MSPNASKYLRTSALAKRYGKSARTIQRWAAAGKLGRVRRGRRVLLIAAKTRISGAIASRPVADSELPGILADLFGAIHLGDRDFCRRVATRARDCMDRKRGAMFALHRVRPALTDAQTKAAQTLAICLSGRNPSAARLRFCIGSVLARLLPSTPRQTAEIKSLVAMSPALKQFSAGGITLDEYLASGTLASTRAGGAIAKKLGLVSSAAGVARYAKLKRADARDRNELAPSARSIARLARLSRATVAKFQKKA